MDKVAYRKYLEEKYGENFLSLPKVRRLGKSLRRIGKEMNISGEQVRLFLKQYFPESLYPAQPERLHLTSQLLQLSGRRDGVLVKYLLARHGIKPVGKYMGRLLWGEDAKQFFQISLARPCQKCNESVSSIDFRFKYCAKCRRVPRRSKIS